MTEKKLRCGCTVDQYGYIIKLCPQHLQEMKEYIKEAKRIKAEMEK